MKPTTHSIEIDFQQMVNNAPNMVWIVDQNNTIIWCNNTSIKLLNSEHENILNKNIFSFIPANLQKLFEKLLTNVLKHRESLEPMEFKIHKGTGEMLDVELCAFPHYLEGEIFAQVVFRDISRRKINEKLLHDRERLTSLGQITAGLIHEIKNPLTAVKGFLQLAKESYSPLYLDTAESELNKALETIQNLLQVSKPDLQDEPFVSIDISKEIPAIIALFQDKQYSIEFELDIRNAGFPILGKRNSLQKAAFNLIKNSIEAISGKGKINVEHYLQDEWLHIKLSDTGVGIPQDQLKMLGTPFYSTKSDGTGLGLTQVYTTIHELGGIMEVESVVGEGTTFHIQLPAKNHRMQSRDNNSFLILESAV